LKDQSKTHNIVWNACWVPEINIHTNPPNGSKYKGKKNIHRSSCTVPFDIDQLKPSLQSLYGMYVVTDVNPSNVVKIHWFPCKIP